MIIIRRTVLAFSLLVLALGGYSQQDSVLKQESIQGIGFRFGSHFNHFPRSDEFNLVSGWFSTGVLGAYYHNYKQFTALELGINLVYKNAGDNGFPNLPVIMEDFQDDQATGVTALETDLKVGPRLGYFQPQIGYVIGYYFNAEGFEQDNPRDINRVYVHLPFGCSFRLPTNYGFVGIGAHYYVGLANVIKKPDNAPTDFNGGRIRAFHIELTMSFGTRRN